MSNKIIEEAKAVIEDNRTLIQNRPATMPMVSKVDYRAAKHARRVLLLEQCVQKQEEAMDFLLAGFTAATHEEREEALMCLGEFRSTFKEAAELHKQAMEV